MKLTTLCAAAAISTSLLILPSAPTVKTSVSHDNNLLACAWFPSCGDPDIYGPILQPKDTKKENKDTKDGQLS